MDPNTNIAAWMIAGGLNANAARDRNRDHLRALKASRSASPGLLGRLAASVAAIRPGTATAEPACCPA